MQKTALRTEWRAITPAARLLIVNQCGISVGFFMVVPFLSTYLLDDLGFATALVGTVLGIRTVTQHGLYVLGGAGADRLSLRTMIMTGCGLRVVAFALFASSTAPAAIIVATALTGLAGAVFNPAMQTYLMQESPDRRAESFTLLNMANNFGILVGPLLGAALLSVDFQAVSAGACGLFAVLTVAQGFVLPAVRRPRPESGVWRSWGHVVTNRRFLAFTLAGSAYMALFNQLYLVLPLEAQRVTGRSEAVSAVFLTSTAIGLLGGVRLTAACRKRWPAGTSMAVGLAVTGAGFVPLAVSAPLTATPDAALGPAAALATGWPVLLATVLFTVGITVANPFMMELIPVVGTEELVGTYYGYFYLIAAWIAAGVTTVTGALLDIGGAGRWVPFAFLCAAGAAGAAGIAAMQRRGNFS